MKKLMFTASLVMLSAIAFSQTKNDTLVLTTTPPMHCQGCENKIKSNIRFVKGVKNIETSLPDQNVTIIYDGRKSKYEDFVAAFKKIGYEIKKTETTSEK
ncbi:MAG: heavy-metal-associated domain-containing protein [Candidatus Limimorpha sp.]